MRLVVTGSRAWRNVELLNKTLDDLHLKYTVEVLFHGEQSGADLMAKRWAESRGLPNFGCPYAGFYGKSGGPIRNGWLLEFGQPDLVVAFPTKESVGTWNCVTQAKQKGIPIRIVAGTFRPKPNVTVNVEVVG